MSTTLERIAGGDRDAVPACLALYGKLVWALARKYSSDASDAEDAAQEIFVDLWRHAGRFNPNIASEATFVAMIARRRLIDRARKRGRTIATTVFHEEHAPAVQSPVEWVDVADEATHVREKMSEISPDQRKILEMAIDRGMTQLDISHSLGIPLGTVKARARRGLLRLRELVLGSAKPLLKEGDTQ